MGDAPRGPLLVRCPAKVNLGLWILGRRPDGYHEIDTILQTIALEDDLRLEPAPAGRTGLVFRSEGRPIPGGGPNLVERAYALLEEEGLLPRGAGLTATLVKRIPIGAGLGGGSSDAAGMLAGASRYFGLDLPAARLEGLAARLGSDVPFFVRGGTARATGRGDRVGHLCPIPPLWVVLASPPLLISTGWAYGALRNELTARGSDASILGSVLAEGRLDGVADAMRNVFEDVI
ncbi:MAG: 4-(cytidine 5'-diphospho)-2-C-methyl-D-erythritol kinase, partial [Hyphomicrobiales bacterium]